MRRRDFISGCGAAGFGLAARAQMPPPKKAKIRSSVMLPRLPGTLEQKLEIAARAGLQSVELSGEYTTWSEAERRGFLRLTRSFGLGVDAVNAMPRWRDMPVSMVDAADRDNLLAEVGKNIALARRIEAPMLTLMSGPALPGVPRERQFGNLVESAKGCVALAEKAGVTLLVEPRNDQAETPGFYLATVAEALELIDRVASPRLRLLFDVYHERMQTGGVTGAIEKAARYTRIYHVAGAPGRREPGTGEIDYAAVYKAIAKTGFNGYIAMEYDPSGDPVASLIRSVDAMRAALA